MKKISLIFATVTLILIGCKKFEEWGVADSSKIPMGIKQSIGNISVSNSANGALFKYGFSNISKVKSISLWNVSYDVSQNDPLILEEKAYVRIAEFNVPSADNKIDQYIVKKDEMFYYLKGKTSVDINQTTAFAKGAKSDFIFIVENNEGYKADSVSFSNSVID